MKYFNLLTVVVVPWGPPKPMLRGHSNVMLFKDDGKGNSPADTPSGC